MKKGSAIIFVVVAMVVTGLIFSYIFSRTANTQISNLSQFKEIKKIYEKDLIDTNDDNLYDDVNDNVYTEILSIINK